MVTVSVTVSPIQIIIIILKIFPLKETESK